jgi:hypothetical protein
VKQSGAATQIAVSPNGYPWVITSGGAIYYWNGTFFVKLPFDGCATSIGVGPSAVGLTYGDPWIIGCDGGYNVNGSIYQLQSTGWELRSGSAAQIAVSPEGVAWVVNLDGSISYWNGFSFVSVPNGCATGIAVGSDAAKGATPFGDAWITGCDAVSGGHPIFQAVIDEFISWKQIPGVATQISVSPDGVPWVVHASGDIYYRK